MQSLSRQRPTNNLNNQSRAIAFIAILLFALAGLVSGFSVGAFVHPKFLPIYNPGSETNQPSANQSQTATHTQHSVHYVKLGWPVVSQYDPTEVANGTNTYTLSASAVDQSIDTGHGHAVHASGITFKLWLVQR
ncbi:MAG: hypothetical protein JOZ18_00070, partial [Chloroflexi bacterium]|nr:hypothetical protein [Chloroflexota bacterium]